MDALTFIAIVCLFSWNTTVVMSERCTSPGLRHCSCRDDGSSGLFLSCEQIPRLVRGSMETRSTRNIFLKMLDLELFTYKESIWPRLVMIYGKHGKKLRCVQGICTTNNSAFQTTTSRLPMFNPTNKGNTFHSTDITTSVHSIISTMAIPKLQSMTTNEDSTVSTISIPNEVIPSELSDSSDVMTTMGDTDSPTGELYITSEMSSSDPTVFKFTVDGSTTIHEPTSTDDEDSEMSSSDPTVFKFTVDGSTTIHEPTSTDDEDTVVSILISTTPHFSKIQDSNIQDHYYYKIFSFISLPTSILFMIGLIFSLIKIDQLRKNITEQRRLPIYIGAEEEQQMGSSLIEETQV